MTLSGLGVSVATKTHGQIINGLIEGQFGRLEKIIPAGTLEARRISDGVNLYWRVTAEGKTTRIVIGRYDPKAPPKSLAPTRRGYSIRAAARAAEDMALEHVAHRDSGGYPALRRQRRQQRAAAVAAEEEAQQYTLAALMAAHGEDFVTAAKALGAWVEDGRPAPAQPTPIAGQAYQVLRTSRCEQSELCEQ